MIGPKNTLAILSPALLTLARAPYTIWHEQIQARGLYNRMRTATCNNANHNCNLSLVFHQEHASHLPTGTGTNRAASSQTDINHGPLRGVVHNAPACWDSIFGSGGGMQKTGTEPPKLLLLGGRTGACCCACPMLMMDAGITHFPFNFFFRGCKFKEIPVCHLELTISIPPMVCQSKGDPNAKL